MGASCTWLLAALTYRILDLKVNNFGSTTDDFRVQNVNVGVQKIDHFGVQTNDFGV